MDNRRPPPRRPDRTHDRGRPPRERTGEPYVLYGLHTVAAALANPRRAKHRLVATRNALARLVERMDGRPMPLEAEIVEPRGIDRLVDRDAVHQGVALVADPLDDVPLDELAEARLIVALDQITDPHNVGAILRSAVALGAGGLLTTTRHAPTEGGVLAKAASGAVDLLPIAAETNLSRALVDLRGRGFTAIGLDSEAPDDLEAVPIGERVVLVLGAEGKGIRPGVRANLDAMARLSAPGAIASLNVSNAAAIALYAIGRRLGGTGRGGG
jgi:23S rRNA (guanosine2251-2'-O)-methyltransferase